MEDILFFTGAVILGIIIIVSVILLLRKIINFCKARKFEKNYSSDVKIKHNVRYTEGSSVETKDGEVNISYNQKDIILTVDKNYIVGSKNKILPGKYTLLTVNNSVSEFALRVNGIVSSYSHGTNIVLGEGDVICPTSQNIILR